MKNLLSTAIGFALVLTLGACGGGGDEDTPPPPTSSPLTDQGRHDVLHLAQRTRRECCSAVAPVFINVAGQISSGGAISTPQPDLSGCQTRSTEIMLSLQTLYPEGMHRYLPFLTSQAKAMANCVGGSLQSAGIPINSQTTPIFFAAGAGILRNALPGANPVLAGAAQIGIQALLSGR